MLVLVISDFDEFIAIATALTVRNQDPRGRERKGKIQSTLLLIGIEVRGAKHENNINAHRLVCVVVAPFCTIFIRRGPGLNPGHPSHGTSALPLSHRCSPY